MESLGVSPVSKAGATHRVGRTGPGKCFSPPGPSSRSSTMTPRTSLAGVRLGMESLGIGDLLRFDFVGDPIAHAHTC